MGWADVEALLGREIGLDPVAVGPALIRRAVGVRVEAIGAAGLDAYVGLLAGSADERRALVEEVVIPESWFFRDVRPFAFLRAEWEARALGGPAGRPVRLLSLPCSTGEEPYSIAMTLLDAGAPAGRFQVEAVDVSERALARAGRGVYGRNAFRGADLAYRDRHFRTHPEGFELAQAVRRLVRFRRGNLLDPGLLGDEPPFDVVFCRNLLIYLSAPARAAATSTFERLLRPSGLLFVGHAEMLTLLEGRFVPVADRGTFAYRRRAPSAALPPDPRPPMPQLPPARRPTRPRPAPAAARPAPATVPSSDRPVSAPGPVSDRPVSVAPVPVEVPAVGPSPLELAAELANARRFDEAAEACLRAIGAGGPTAEAYFLLGTIRQAAGDPSGAATSFQKAAYLDPRHDEALLALALIAERRGDRASADGYRRRAGRAHRRKEAR